MLIAEVQKWVDEKEMFEDSKKRVLAYFDKI